MISPEFKNTEDKKTGRAGVYKKNSDFAGFV